MAIQFATVKIYELNALWIKPNGGAEKLMNYFGKVMPVAQRHGVRILLRFEPVQAAAGDLFPSVIGFGEWPSLTAFDDFMADPDYRSLYPLRDSAVERLVVTHLRVPEATSITVGEGKIYELSGLWIRPDGGAERLADYSRQVMPVAAEYGARRLVAFEPVRAAWGDFLPTRLGLTEWPTLAAFDAFQRDGRFQALKPLRDSALSRLVVTHGRLAVPDLH